MSWPKVAAVVAGALAGVALAVFAAWLVIMIIVQGWRSSTDAYREPGPQETGAYGMHKPSYADMAGFSVALTKIPHVSSAKAYYRSPTFTMGGGGAYANVVLDISCFKVKGVFSAECQQIRDSIVRLAWAQPYDMGFLMVEDTTGLAPTARPAEEFVELTTSVLYDKWGQPPPAPTPTRS